MSTLRDAVDEYLHLRRGLGFKLREEGQLLPDFVSFLEREGGVHVTTEWALRWAARPVGTSQARCATRLRMVRLFAAYYRSTDPRTEVPDPSLLPYLYQRKAPYIFTPDQIQRVIAAAWTLPSSKGLRPWTYATVVGLAAATGMRSGELTRLDRDDVDLDRGVLHIRRSKFGKSRLVPVHPSVQAALGRYVRRRDALSFAPTTRGFLVSDRGHRLSCWALRRTFVILSVQCGLRAPGDSHGPRLHDLRHTFAVRTVIDWYRRGENVEQRLPTLATYLGHGHVADTYWYLSAVPELLALAVVRLDEPREEGAKP